MEALTQSLAQHAGQVLVVLLVLVGLTLAWVGIQASAQRKVMKKWRHLLQDSNGGTLEEVLEAHLRERQVLQNQMRTLDSRVQELEAKMRVDKRHLGIVRYDAFEDVGGEQSFAMALYDDEGDGVVVTSLIGRTDCRVYAKALKRGRSDRTLSQEEQRAIREAEGASSRSMITAEHP